MVEKLKAMWLAFLNALHLYTRGQHDKVCKTVADMYELQIHGLNTAADIQRDIIKDLQKENADLVKKINDLTEQLRQTTAQRDELQTALDPITAERDSLREQIQTYKDAAFENLSYVKETQKQLSKVLHDHEDFGFKRAMGIPGSTSIRTIDSAQDGKPVALLEGRTIVLDELTKAIDETPDMGSRLRLIMDFMEKYGVFKKIGKDLFSYGAVRCVLGYNEGCENYELYYEIVANGINMDSLLVVRNPERKDEE